MILSSMTTDEMFRELMIDKDNCIRWREHLRRRVAEIARRGSKFPRFLFFDYLSPRKNQWLVQASIVNRHPYNGILFASCVVRHAEDGWYMHQAVYNSTTCIQLMMTPHCIRRYAERTGREDVKMPELMKVWMMCNHDICGENDESLSGRRSRGGMYEQRHYCSNEGILMGDWHEGKNGRTFMAKTFITYDMAKDRQVEVFGQSRKRLLGIENWRELLTV